MIRIYYIYMQSNFTSRAAKKPSKIKSQYKLDKI